MKKVSFALDVENGWPPVAVEHVWCEKASAVYELKNAPFFIHGLAFGDKFTAEPDAVNGCIFEFTVVGTSGHSLVWVLERGDLKLEDRPHRRIASRVVRPRAIERLLEYLQLSDPRNIEQRLALLAALQLVDTQQFGSPGPDPVALRLDQAHLFVVQKAQSSLLLDSAHQHWVHIVHRRSLSRFNPAYARQQAAVTSGVRHGKESRP